ncbi:hypothetical protein, partial [Novosphingobium sp.]|uniref:hypothetical protein n=1 Tax=Novosphingobium sp. TaxID=1874826 RepID=UPI002B476D41
RSKMRIFDDDRRYRLVMTKLFKILLLTAWILAPFGGGRFDGRDLTNGSIFPFFLTISFIYISDATLVTLGYKKNRDI